jgi:predicted DNA-binding protein
MSANDVRKNFVFKKDVAQHLEELAKRNGKSMTVIVQDLIEKEYQDISIEQKLEAIKKLAGCGNGLFKDMTIQSIKSSMDKDYV